MRRGTLKTAFFSVGLIAIVVIVQTKNKFKNSLIKEKKNKLKVIIPPLCQVREKKYSLMTDL